MPPTLSPEPPVVSQEPSPGPKKVKRSRLGIFFALFLLLVLLIATFAWYLTTDSGIRHFVLPRISKAVGQKVRARAVHWSPLASIEMEDLQIGPDGSPLFEAKKLTVTYKPEGLRQRRVESIDCVQPVIRIEEKTSSSKSDLLDILKPETPASNENKSSRGAMDFHIGHLRVEDLNLSYITPQKTLFLQNVKFEGQNIQAGNNGIYDLDGLFSLRKSGASSEEKLAGRLQGHLEAQMDAELLPALVQGQITLAELHSSAKNDPWLGMSSSLQMNFSENELKQGTLSFQRGSEKLAAIHCSGPLDFKKREAELDLKTDPIGSNILNALFSARDVDFQSTTASFTSHLSLSEKGQKIALSGSLDAPVVAFQSGRIPDAVWKPISLTGDYAVEVDFPQNRLTVKSFSLHGKRENQPFLEGSLSHSMSVTWGSGRNDGVEDSEFSLQILPFDITSLLPLMELPPDWKLSRGMLDATLKVVAQQQGQKLSFDTHARLAGVILDSPLIKLDDSDVQLDGALLLEQLAQLSTVNELVLNVTEKTTPLLTARLKGDRQLFQRKGKASLQIQSLLSGVGKILPALETTYSSGTFQGKFDWDQSDSKNYICGIAASIDDASLVYHQVPYDQLSMSFAGNLQGSPEAIRLDNGKLTVARQGAPAGNCDLNLLFSQKDGAFQLNYHFQDWKEPFFSPFFAVWFPAQKLRSMELSSQGNWQYQNGNFAWKSDAELKNFVLEGSSPTPLKPLSAKLTTDVAYGTNHVLQIRGVTIQLDPVPGADNLLRVSGSGQSLPTRTVADLKVEAHALDLTSYYDQLFPAETNLATSASAEIPALSPTPSSTAELAAYPFLFFSQSLPTMETVSTNAPAKPWDLHLQVQADQVRIRALQLTELQIPYEQKGDVLKMENGSVKINGMPLTARIWTDPATDKPPFHFEAQGESLPLAPLIDTFKPSFRGMLAGKANIKFFGQGRGVSSNDLQQNLDAGIEIAARDTHMQQLPAVQKALKQLGGALQSPDITASTLEQVDASAHIAGGKIHTDNLHLTGSALEATLRGDVLWSQELNMEAGLKIKREVMNRSALLSQFTQLVSSDTGDWVKLPNAVKIGGTVGDPKIEYDLKKLVGGAAVNTGVNILKDLLGKKTQPAPNSDTNSPPATNAPPQNSINNLLDLLKKKKNP